MKRRVRTTGSQSLNSLIVVVSLIRLACTPGLMPASGAKQVVCAFGTSGNYEASFDHIQYRIGSPFLVSKAENAQRRRRELISAGV